MACLSPYYVDNETPVGCGRCPECKLRRAQEWAFRLMAEDKVSSSAYFVTLTYSTDSVPITPDGLSLNKKDLTNFFKRLRKRQEKHKKLYHVATPKKKQPLEDRTDIWFKPFSVKCVGEEKLKYYAVGEYGTKGTKRPHYHIILFNLKGAIQIGTRVSKNGTNYTLYKSQDIEDSWVYYKPEKVRERATRTDINWIPNSMGRVDIGQASGEAAAYCAKYIDKVDYTGDWDSRQKKFSVMSKNLGISYLHNAENIRFHREDLSRTYLNGIKGHKIPMPRYYKEKLYTESEREDQKLYAEQALSEAQKEERERLVKLYSNKFSILEHKITRRENKIKRFEQNIQKRD